MTSEVYNVHPGLVFKAVNTSMLLKPSLDTLEEVSVNCILWKAIQKLSILQHLLPQPRAVWTQDYLSIPIRMTALQRIVLPEDREPEHTRLLTHVQKWRYFLQNVLEETVFELSFQGSTHFLEYVLCCNNLLNYDNIILKQENIDLNSIIQFLKEKIVVVREQFEKTLLYFSEMTGPCLEQAVVNSWVQGEAVSMLTEENQQVKVNQNKYRLLEKETNASEAMEKYNKEIKEGNKISVEIENHILYMTSKLQTKFDNWSRRYNSEVESLDIALLQLKSRQEEQKDQYLKLLEKFNERQEELEVLQEEADIRDREIELNRLRNKAAIIIQTCWRRYLLRRFLKRKIALKKGKHGKKNKKSKSSVKKNKNKKSKRKV